ncbi:MAG: type II secretion system secretin GspD [Alphaproteobacteria bacterium]|nr:type II secretion system secretin GspD [Alphaproteobacteria bacterium]
MRDPLRPVPRHRSGLALGLVLAVSACSPGGSAPAWLPFPMRAPDSGVSAPPRISGAIEPAPDASIPQPRAVMGNASRVPRTKTPSIQVEPGSGDVTLNFEDTDIRDVVRVILGDFLKASYTIDPAVKGTATVHTAQPVKREMLLPLLDSLLGQNGASLVQHNDIYNVVPTGTAQAGPANPGEQTEIVPLRYASAPELAKVLAPYVGQGGKIAAGPARDSVIVSGGASARASLIALIHTFDVDFLAGQSYAIFPVASAEPATVAAEVQHYVQSAGQGDASEPVRVIALERISAILVVASDPSYLARIGDFVAQVDEVGRTTERRLHVYYVQNGTALEIGAVLQRAFVPQAAGGNPFADQGLEGSLAPGSQPTAISTPAAAGLQSAASGLPGTGTGLGGTGLGGLGQSAGTAGGSTVSSAPLSATPTPLSALGPGGEQGPQPTRGIRIIPDRRNNALLIWATPSEYATIEATLRKIDILPLQVLVEATIAEVTLNDALQYGTQFFLNQHHNSEILSNGTTNAITPSFPGFAYTFTSSPANITITALQSVTDVRVISDPQLVVLDNQSARLQVGDIVPIVTQSAVSVTTAGAPVVNSVEYRETGVILQVTPRVNSGGLVTLDIEQQVSAVVPTTSSSINSPTIQQRQIKSRVVVQDGETIGLGGLIKDTNSYSNQGVPWLTNVPILGALFGTRDNSVQRTELLVLLTPRVIQDQRGARALTEDMRAKLGRLGAAPRTRDPIEPPGPLRP